MDFRIAGLGPDAVDYLAAWDLQRQVHAAGRGRRPAAHRPAARAPAGLHRRQAHRRPTSGPPIPAARRSSTSTAAARSPSTARASWSATRSCALPDHVKVVDYVRRVEEALIGVCRDLGVATARVPGRSGVWLRADDRGPERKVAAIGIRVSRGVTMHGFALNCDVDLGWYDRFVPCGIADAGVTSLSEELGRDVTVSDVLPLVERHLDRPAGLGAVRRRRPTTSARPEPGRTPRIELVTP